MGASEREERGEGEVGNHLWDGKPLSWQWCNLPLHYQHQIPITTGDDFYQWASPSFPPFSRWVTAGQHKQSDSFCCRIPLIDCDRKGPQVFTFNGSRIEGNQCKCNVTTSRFIFNIIVCAWSGDFLYWEQKQGIYCLKRCFCSEIQSVVTEWDRDDLAEI